MSIKYGINKTMNLIICLFTISFSIVLNTMLLQAQSIADKDKPLVLAFIPQENPEKLIGDKTYR
jgi:hypothetical protein